ncbi:hypothetical protein CHR53_09630 [Neobacillus mesonae]|uniref:Uncharacterized protein n=1 Tax=Neobacillus mesonae TaxID=1193713 RepID=A0A3Q9QRL2_9BACI|nr:hypothetical protein CHR53_09630 [Neobacillus mesonae]
MKAPRIWRESLFYDAYNLRSFLKSNLQFILTEKILQNSHIPKNIQTLFIYNIIYSFVTYSFFRTSVGKCITY